MGDLTDQKYWDKFHDTVMKPHEQGAQPKGPSLARRLLGERLYSYRLSYTSFRLFDTILRQHLPVDPGLKVVELGSAPGRFLLDLRRVFQYEPYGIEYSAVGCQHNRDLFAANGIPPENVIEGDVFADEIQSRWGKAFDIVFSLSFIEHFDDPPKTLAAHLGLLKDDGYLVITCPNLSGLNKKLYGFFNPDDLVAHNLELTNFKAFKSIFDDASLETLYCGMYGTYSFQMYKPVPGTARARVLKGLSHMQQGMNVFYRILFGDRGFETTHFSPFMVYVGRKRWSR